MHIYIYKLFIYTYIYIYIYIHIHIYIEKRERLVTIKQLCINYVYIYTLQQHKTGLKLKGNFIRRHLSDTSVTENWSFK